MDNEARSPDDRGCLFCPNHASGWHYKDVGHGRPLILLHGIGMSHVAWKKVINNLAHDRRVLAFDIAGFGITPPVPDNIQPTPANLLAGANSLAETLRHLDEQKQISKDFEYVDVVGNSLGGYLALEAAKLGELGPFRVRSVATISPAGLWKKHYPLRSVLALQLTRLGVRHFPRLTRTLMRRQYTRKLMMAVPVSANVSEEDAYELVNVFASAPLFASRIAFEKFRDCMKDPFKGGTTISDSIRVTIAFGTRDWLLPRSARLRHEIPQHVIWEDRKRWGHVPMLDDPEGVTKFIRIDSRFHPVNIG
ncbi:MAG TPA: alpha/beta hydrolase [Pyrinomonadaceae bacterium]|nr:alpha/beta hydrolase [Pyrinomonadaceae bacterium]